jgi:hypothetical protein
MRPILIGLIVAIMGAMAAPAAAVAAAAAAAPAAKPQTVDPEARKKGMAAVPAILQANNVPCQLADARLIGTSQDPKTKAANSLYEVACTNSEGFVLVVFAGPQPPTGIYTCLEIANQPTSGLKCILPGNANPAAGLAPLLAKDKPSCQLKDARAIGQTTDRTTTEFEIACQDGSDYVADTSFPVSADKPATFNPCVAYAATPGKCTLTDPGSQAAWLKGMAAKMGKPCDVKDQRFVGVSQEGATFFELACNDGKGYMLEVDNKGGVQPAIDCAIADNIAGGCTLTNAHQAQTAQASLYARLAHTAGYQCDVSKYFPFDVSMPGHEVVELACSNRPDGAIGIFPADSSKPSQILDCAHSELVGYRCTFTKASDAYPRLTDDLKKLGKASCVVSGERIAGTTKDSVGYIEVACADGNPGYLVAYALPAMTPKEATACSFAKDLGGGCQMPENNKKG